MVARLIFFLSLLAAPVAAQLPDGSVAPDFEATDLNGQKWRLYDLLAQDKIVMLEISATWCSPCWSYHKSQAMQNLYKVHGPDGDDKLRVLFVEGDPTTNVNCLYGPLNCNKYSEGDWVTGTPYPIIDNAYVSDLYQITYYPTLFAICPNKKLYHLRPLSAADLWQEAATCPVAFGTNNAGIFQYDPGSHLREVCDTLPVYPTFHLINLGSNLLTSATLDLTWNNVVVQSKAWTGSLNLYGEATIQFDTLPLTTSGVLTTRVHQVNGLPYESDTTNNIRHDQFFEAKHFEDQMLLLRIRTDQFGAETYWELRDEAGQVLDSGGNRAVGPNGGGAFPGISDGPGAYGNYALIKDTLVLPVSSSTCYSLHFVDAYGDGMCCNYGTGYYRLYNLSQPTQIILSGGEFEEYDRHGFGAGKTVSATDLVDATDTGLLHLYPNPAQQMLYLSLETPTTLPVQIAVYNTIGQQVMHWPSPAWSPSSGEPFPLDVSALSPGHYVVKVTSPASVLSSHFAIGR